MNNTNKLLENYFFNTPSTKQGKKFKKFQNKIYTNLENKINNIKENFVSNNLDSKNLTEKTKNLIEQNNYSSQQSNINDLKEQYNNTLKEYENLISQISGNTNNYINRVNPNNPYLNKVIQFSSGHICYVTSQGVVKWIPSKDIWQSLNISQNIQTSLDIPWLDTYFTPGTSIPTTPNLISGTNVKMKQSFGNEGTNIFVNEFLPKNTETNYMGCYATNSNNNNMTFIGDSPSSYLLSIQNGNFNEPQLSNNSYQFINSNSQVPGWEFNAILINNSSSWGFTIPYPSGSQAVCIQSTQAISQFIKLNIGKYTLSFSACGRPEYGANTINIYCSNNNTKEPVIFTFTPQTTWQNFTTTFNISENSNYSLGFYGTTTEINNSTAIQNIILNNFDNNSSGEYTYEMCKSAAIEHGYQYFALQNVNPSKSTGYCAVTNSEPALTQYGQSMAPTKKIPLWASNTNETSNSGVVASLSKTGSLQVFNSSGQAIYSSPAKNANPSNYLGCYNDTSNRAIPLINTDGSFSTEGGGTSWNNDYSSSFAFAQEQGFQYFSIQAANGQGYGQSGFTNDLQQAIEYGKANNCNQASDGYIVGGGWSNAIYSTNMFSNYFLILQDDGNMVIYRGTGPNDNQGFIWETATNGQQQLENKSMIAKNGKYGQNWISSGSTLAPGDFIGSSNGNIALVMQSDGNLVLYTYQMDINCMQMNDGNIGGGIAANAAYNLNKKAIPENIGNVAYIDANSELFSYNNNDTSYGNTYTNIATGYDTPGNDIPDAAFSNSTLDTCKKKCNSNKDCAGIVTNLEGTNCWPKTNSMYPYKDSYEPNSDRKIYIRNKQPTSPPIGVSFNTNFTDSYTYQNYIKGEELNNSYGLSNLNSVQQLQLEQLENKLNILSSQLNNLTNNFDYGTQMVDFQTNLNVNGINQYIKNIENANKKSKQIFNETSGNIENILTDSDIVVLQKNYNYLFWSILAVGTILITMNFSVKK